MTAPVVSQRHGSVRARGTTDAAYPGSGTSQACAWNHPFQAFPPEGVPRIATTLKLGTRTDKDQSLAGKRLDRGTHRP